MLYIISVGATKNTEIFVGIVISSEKVGESDIRVRILCKCDEIKDGVKTFTVTGAQKPNAKLKAGVQLFTIAEFSTVGHKVIGVHVLESNHNITKDIKRYYLACAICEVVSKVMGAGFELTAEALANLNNPQPTIREIFTEYFSGLLVELGYDIEPHQDISSAYLYNLDIKIPNTRFFLI